MHTCKQTFSSPVRSPPTPQCAGIFHSLTDLDTPFFSYLYSSDNDAGRIPDTPSTMLDIVLSATIVHIWEHENHRLKQCKHKWDQSLWMACTQSLWSLWIKALALFPCHGVLRLKSSGPWVVTSDEASSPQTPPSPHVNIPHLMVTSGMSGFSAWFVPNAASCNRLYPRWVIVSQASLQGVDTGRHGARNTTLVLPGRANLRWSTAESNRGK